MMCCRDEEWNHAFNYSSNLAFLSACVTRTKGIWHFQILFSQNEATARESPFRPPIEWLYLLSVPFFLLLVCKCDFKVAAWDNSYKLSTTGKNEGDN